MLESVNGRSREKILVGYFLCKKKQRTKQKVPNKSLSNLRNNSHFDIISSLNMQMRFIP